MSDKAKRSPNPPHKKGANRHDSAVKHDKAKGKHSTSKDIHEDRGVRKKKLSKPK